MSRRRKSNVMHLPSLQPSSCSLLTSWYLSRPTIRRALIITTYYVNNQWYWLWPEGDFCGVVYETFALREESGRDTKRCFPPARALRHPRSSDVTAALLNSWSAPSEPIVGTRAGYVDHDLSVICRCYLGNSCRCLIATAEGWIRTVIDFVVVFSDVKLRL